MLANLIIYYIFTTVRFCKIKYFKLRSTDFDLDTSDNLMFYILH